MPELTFSIESAQPVSPSASPVMGFGLRIRAAKGGTTEPLEVHSMVLHSQVRIEPARRKYSPEEQDKLMGLFDRPDRWGKTIRNVLWTHVTTVASSFTGETAVELPVPCSYDFNLAATNYFDSLNGGEIPLAFLFSGSVFYQSAYGGLQIAQISWDQEARFKLQAQSWRALMDRYYPNIAWLGLRKDVFDALLRFKNGRGLPSCERALEELLLLGAEVGVP